MAVYSLHISLTFKVYILTMSFLNLHGECHCSLITSVTAERLTSSTEHITIFSIFSVINYNIQFFKVT